MPIKIDCPECEGRRFLPNGENEYPCHLCNRKGKITVHTKADMKKAVEAYEEYIELLEAELHDSAGFLLAHGIKSSRVEAGKKARAKIQALKESKP